MEKSTIYSLILLSPFVAFFLYLIGKLIYMDNGWTGISIGVSGLCAIILWVMFWGNKISKAVTKETMEEN